MIRVESPTFIYNSAFYDKLSWRNVEVSYLVIYSLVVTLGTTMFKAKKFYTSCVYFCWISEPPAIISLYSINWLGFITEKLCFLRGTDFVFKSNSVKFSFLIF
jgi:hypothetical protein